MGESMTLDGSPTTVVLIEDHLLVRDAIREFLKESSDIRIVGETGTADEGVSLVAARRPSIVLLDISLPGKSGLDAARRIRQQSPETRILVLTAYDYPEFVRAIIELGAHGYLLKNAGRDQVIEAIRAVGRGETVLAPEISQAVVQAFAVGGTEQRSALTVREIEVLRLVAQGRRNQEIAKELVVAVTTVESHMRNILRKLSATNRTHAVQEARRRGLFAGDA